MSLQITYFVHSTTTDNENDLATGHAPGKLSETGEKQARELRQKVQDLNFDQVYTSDLQRAIDTCQIAFQSHGFRRDQRLREIDYGDKTQTPKNWDLRRYINQPYPGGESYTQVEKRVQDFLEFAKKQHPDQHIALVSHQAPQLALEKITRNCSWKKAIKYDWRDNEGWKPGWNYIIK